MRVTTTGWRALALAGAMSLLGLAGCDQAGEPAAEVADAETEGGPLSRPWVDARARGVGFRAVGNEPGWHLEIYPDSRLHLVLDYGSRTLDVPAPPTETERMGDVTVTVRTTEAEGETLYIEVRETACQDNMSGAMFDYQVLVRLGERDLEGCGHSLDGST
ncbi:COG3650 family protein [Isoalcanivorax indicus]|uniref:COG3650 family protein n=1 Tax=Isoalcanivorax indicus TaxID=2202653 RepID=UPI0013C47133|nr:hypothetical protein [Isoalcanivorax indicus]